MIDSKQALEALGDIGDITKRVRQSLIYQLSSLAMLMWGVLVIVGNVANWMWLRYGGAIWIGVNLLGLAGLLAIGSYNHARSHVRTFDARVFLMLLLVFAFGAFCCWLGHFSPRQQATFWPVYFMLFYVLAGLWFGYAFVAIGATIVVLTLIGHFYIADPGFLLWMAAVNGGGLIAGGLWMRRS